MVRGQPVRLGCLCRGQQGVRGAQRRRRDRETWGGGQGGLVLDGGDDELLHEHDHGPELVVGRLAGEEVAEERVLDLAGGRGGREHPGGDVGAQRGQRVGAQEEQLGGEVLVLCAGGRLVEADGLVPDAREEHGLQVELHHVLDLVAVDDRAEGLELRLAGLQVAQEQVLQAPQRVPLRRGRAQPLDNVAVQPLQQRVRGLHPALLGQHRLAVDEVQPRGERGHALGGVRLREVQEEVLLRVVQLLEGRVEVDGWDQ